VALTLTRSQLSPSLAYVASYSDIEHEVLQVTSGRRATVTYNLYLVDPALGPETPSVAPNLKSVSNLQVTLQRFLKSPEFLPDGGMLGFGLAHLYPVTFETELREMTNYLKGEDAHVYRAFRELQLQPSLQMIYNDYQDGLECGIMLDKIVRSPSYDYEVESYWNALIGLGSVSVNKTEDATSDLPDWTTNDDDREFTITWISPFNGWNQLQDFYMAYGNEVSADYIYCSPCLVVHIPAASDRV